VNRMKKVINNGYNFRTGCFIFEFWNVNIKI
jgi:hypothetical protein